VNQNAAAADAFTLCTENVLLTDAKPCMLVCFELRSFYLLVPLVLLLLFFCCYCTEKGLFQVINGYFLIFQNEPQSEGRKGIVLMEKCK